MTYIKEIELNNFKSFSGSNKFTFTKTINAIVGANGSGKSNIIDAIMFVLGESSKKEMRSEMLSDLVFNGGKKQKPAETAYVKLTLDNSDGSFKSTEEREVALMRKVDKSGKSAFRVNGRASTREEILNLLAEVKLDKNNFNIVPQGEILEITSLQPEEKLEIIKSLSGISVFEEKKEKSIDEMKKVDENINKIEMMQKERQRFMDQLNEEKKRADEFKELKEQQRTLKVKSLLLRKQSIDKDLASLQAEYDVIKGKSGGLEREIEELAKKKSDINREIEDINLKAGEEGEKEISEAEENYRSLEGEVGRLRILSNTDAEQLNQIASTIKNLESSKEDIEKQIEAENGMIGRDTKTLRSLEEKRVELDKISSKAENYHAKVEDLEKELGKINKELYDYKLALSNYPKLLEKQEKIAALSESKASLTAEKNSSTIKFSELKSEVERLRSELSQHERSIKNIEQSLISKRSSMFEYSRAVEVSSKLSASLPGVYGTLSQLFRVKDISHSEAIFNAIGRRADFIVVDTEDTASKAIEVLKSNRLGSFSFIPLNKIIYFPVSGRPGETGVIDYLINLVEYDQKFEGAVRFALSDTVLFDSFQNAKKVIGKYRMVTLDGTVFEKNGVISGGSSNRSDTLALNRSISELTRDLEKQNAEKNELSEKLSKKDGELNFLLSRINYSEQKLKEVERELNEAQSSVKTLSGSEGDISKKISELEESRAKLIESLRMFETPAADQKNYKAEIDILDKEIKELEIKIANSSNKIENILKFELNNTARRLQELAKERSKFESEVSQLRGKLGSLEKDLEASKAEVESKSKTLISLRRRREELMSDLTKIDKQIDGLSQDNQKFVNQLNELNLKKAGITAKLETLEEEMKAYDLSGISLEEKDDLQNVQSRLNSMTRKVDNFGPINELAVSKYDEALAKFNENKAQLDILNGEKQKLLDVIRDIDQKKLQALMDTLSVLNDIFDKTFNFVTGGHASLIPENSEDVFGTGLDVRVDLPNKKVHSIVGLSGGEQSIVAICLLLAMSKLTGSQFYVLDEVDAALDSVNASKFSSLLKNFSEGAQFIIISHNDTTILNVDKAYGVYMDDSGISRAVSIDINETIKQKAQ